MQSLMVLFYLCPRIRNLRSVLDAEQLTLYDTQQKTTTSMKLHTRFVVMKPTKAVAESVVISIDPGIESRGLPGIFVAAENANVGDRIK